MRRPRTRRARTTGGRARVATIAALGLVLAGCASLPTPAGLHVVRGVPAGEAAGASDVRLAPPGPFPGAGPAQIVEGFLQAQVSAAGHYAVARQFLAPGALWRADVGTNVLAGPGVQVVGVSTLRDGVAVRVRAQRVARISSTGQWSPAVDSLEATFREVSVGGQWRLASVPSGLWLSDQDVSRSFQDVVLYFPASQGDVLVGDPVYLQVPASALPTAMTRALLRGPSGWLAPALRSPVPPGTFLIGSAAVLSGVVTVDLSRGIEQAGEAQRRLFAAELVQSLQELPGVSGVRLNVSGHPLALGPGVPMVLTDRYGAPLNPDAVSGTEPVSVVSKGQLVALVPTLRSPHLLANGRPTVTLPGTEHVLRITRQGDLLAGALSPDGRLAAALLETATGAQVVAGPASGPLEARVAPGDATNPAWAKSPAGTALAWLDGPAGLEVLPAGGPAQEVSAPGLRRLGSVVSVVPAPDGVQVAVVAGSRGAGLLYVGWAESTPAGVVLRGLHLVTPDLADVSAIAWSSDEDLAVLARAGGGAVTLWSVSSDGSQVTALSLSGLPAAPSSVAAAPGQPVLLGCDGRIYLLAAQGWTPFVAGSDPVYF